MNFKVALWDSDTDKETYYAESNEMNFVPK